MTVSYSGISMYNQCPSSFNRKYNLKEEAGAEPTRETAPAMFRGTDIHNSIEDYLLGKRNNLHKEINTEYLGFCGELRHHETKAELAFAFDDKWEQVAFDDPRAEIRGFMDAVRSKGELIVYEWKTGKEYPEHANQRHLYGLCALLLFPEYDSVRVIGVYLDLKIKPVENTYTRDQIATYKWTWARKINKTKPPQPYPMRPSWKCRFCNYSKKQGGKCPN